MGQLLAQKQAAAAAATAAGATASAYAATAQVKAGEAMDQAGVMAASAKQQIIKGVHRAKNITPEEKAKLLSRASTVLTIASIVCPAGRVRFPGCRQSGWVCDRAVAIWARGERGTSVTVAVAEAGFGGSCERLEAEREREA